MTDTDSLVEIMRADGSFVCTEEYMKNVFNNLSDRVKTIIMLTSETPMTIDGATMFKIYLPIMTYTLCRHQPSIEPKMLADELVDFIKFKMSEEDNTYEFVVPHTVKGIMPDFSDSDDIEAEILAFLAAKFYERALTL